MNLIGNTPMIKIIYFDQGVKKHIYTKLEYYNITGSIKDRMVEYVLREAKRKGELKEHMPIIEATSGNTGISLAALGSYYKHPVIIFMPDWCSKERVELMKSFGAEVHLISKEEGGFKRCIKEADKLALTLHGYRMNQFSNNDNKMAHYQSTALEIIQSVPEVSSFTSGIGTGGTLMGIGMKLKEYNHNIKVIALEPSKMALLSGSKTLEQHKIEGIGDDFIPDLVEKEIIDDVYQIDDEDAINMSRLLARKLGLGVGISSGANFLSAILANRNYDGACVTVFPDDNKKYLSTELVDDVCNNQAFLSNRIELLDYEILL